MSPESQTGSKDDLQHVLSDKELTDIKQKLETGYCNPVWKECIVTLIDEVERLRSLLDLVAQQQKKRKKKEQ